MPHEFELITRREHELPSVWHEGFTTLREHELREAMEGRASWAQTRPNSSNGARPNPRNSSNGPSLT